MRLKSTIKRFLPKSVHLAYNRLISKRRIQRRLGAWFDVEWKRKAASADQRQWVETYDRSWSEWSCRDLTSEDLRRIRLKVEKCNSLLDVGCGDGYLLKALINHAQMRCGVDISGVGLRKAQQTLGLEVQLVQSFAESLPFKDRSFEVVVCVHTLEHVKSLIQAVAELKRVTAKRLIVLVPMQAEVLPYSEDYHLHNFKTKAELLNAFHLPRAVCERYSTPKGEALYEGEVLLLTAEI